MPSPGHELRTHAAMIFEDLARDSETTATAGATSSTITHPAITYRGHGTISNMPVMVPCRFSVQDNSCSPPQDRVGRCDKDAIHSSQGARRSTAECTVKRPGSICAPTAGLRSVDGAGLLVIAAEPLPRLVVLFDDETAAVCRSKHRDHRPLTGVFVGDAVPAWRKNLDLGVDGSQPAGGEHKIRVACEHSPRPRDSTGFPGDPDVTVSFCFAISSSSCREVWLSPAL